MQIVCGNLITQKPRVSPPVSGLFWNVRNVNVSHQLLPVQSANNTHQPTDALIRCSVSPGSAN